MSITRVVLDHDGMAKLLLSQDLADDLAERGARIADQAGAGHDVVEVVGKDRVRVSVVTATFGARRSEARSRSLTSAVDAGR